MISGIRFCLLFFQNELHMDMYRDMTFWYFLDDCKNLVFSRIPPAFDLLNYLIGADMSFFRPPEVLWSNSLTPISWCPSGWEVIWPSKVTFGDIWVIPPRGSFVSLYSGILLDFWCFAFRGKTKTKHLAKLSLDLVMGNPTSKRQDEKRT